MIRVKTKDGEFDIAMQQYDCGLYVAVYQNGRIKDQFSTTVTQTQFMEEIADIIIE